MKCFWNHSWSVITQRQHFDFRQQILGEVALDLKSDDIDISKWQCFTLLYSRQNNAKSGHSLSLFWNKIIQAYECFLLLQKIGHPQAQGGSPWNSWWGRVAHFTKPLPFLDQNLHFSLDQWDLCGRNVKAKSHSFHPTTPTPPPLRVLCTWRL